ncbi:MAG: efflux RND transporter periplasmic adaptor subunit [Chloroflexi bacterium]|nr:efflux RND transporter periplasmic adaptor subunit [Chloroflexota bacterium]
MERFYASLKTLRPVQAMVLVLALLASAGATYAGYELSSGSPSSGLAEDQQLIPIGFGDLVRQVTTSGSLEFPNRETLSFGTAGKVERLLVRDGQSVTAGQELARLDAATAATLAQTVAQAQVDIITAQKLLDELAIPTELSLAQARRKVAGAEFDLQAAREALDGLLNSAALDLAQARQKVAKAEFDLKAAGEALDEANVPFSSEQIKTQEQTVASVRVKVRDAEEALGGLGVSFSQSLAQALLNQADAKADLVAARNALDTYEAANIIKLNQAREDQAQAQTVYDEIALRLEDLLASQASGVEGLFGPILQTEEFLATLQDTLDSANAELVPLEQLVTKKEKAESDLAEATSALGDLAADATTPSIEAQLAKIEDARTNLGAVLNSGLDATVAEAELAALKLGLSAVESGANPAQISLFESDFVQAWAKLGKEEESLADMIAGPDAVTVELRSREIDVAAASLKQADLDLEYLLSLSVEDPALLDSRLAAISEGNLAEITAVPDAVEVALRSQEIEVAMASLDQADQDLADLLAPDAADLALLFARLTAAQTAHAAALEKLRNATITAPFDGIVSLVSVLEGDQVGANAPIVEVVDPSVVEMDGIVDEIDILLLREGLIASITVDALPGRVLEGFVSEIAPVANIQQGVVTYSVRVQIQIPDGLRLRDGLSAVADLVLEQRLNVLLLPQQAIFGSFQAPTVMLETESGIEERPVILGDTDGFWTEVQAGLQEGDRVVIQNAQVSDDPFQALRDRFRGGGGIGGGGAFPGRR